MLIFCLLIHAAKKPFHGGAESGVPNGQAYFPPLRCAPEPWVACLERKMKIVDWRAISGQRPLPEKKATGQIGGSADAIFEIFTVVKKIPRSDACCTKTFTKMLREKKKGSRRTS